MALISRLPDQDTTDPSASAAAQLSPTYGALNLGDKSAMNLFAGAWDHWKRAPPCQRR